MRFRSSVLILAPDGRALAALRFENLSGGRLRHLLFADRLQTSASPIQLFGSTWRCVRNAFVDRVCLVGSCKRHIGEMRKECVLALVFLALVLG